MHNVVFEHVQHILSNVSLGYIVMGVHGRISPKKLSCVILNEVKLVYVDTLKLGPKSYRYSLKISNLYIDIFNFLKYQSTVIKLKLGRKVK